MSEKQLSSEQVKAILSTIQSENLIEELSMLERELADCPQGNLEDLTVKLEQTLTKISRLEVNKHVKR